MDDDPFSSLQSYIHAHYQNYYFCIKIPYEQKTREVLLRETIFLFRKHFYPFRMHFRSFSLAESLFSELR